ncbi:MAG: DUF1080 domain-containing protein, partial [Planctomycetales bacterium]|nr:DUF1080 domain-containing protein [Planctomycetales bacterium]
MRTLPCHSLLVANLLCSTLLVNGVASAQADNTGFQRIFDGQSLHNWQADPQYWRVENGAITGIIPPGETLDHNTWAVWTGGKLEDFELRLKFRLGGKPGANSGIQFRCQVRDVNHVSGYQADLDLGPVWLGRIYDEHGRALLVERGSRVLIDQAGDRRVETFGIPGNYAALFRENEWNDYRIIACRSHVSVIINGTLFSELIDDQVDQQDLAGQLALQLHSGPETRIEFRDIQLRTLDSGAHHVKFTKEPVKEKPLLGVVPANEKGQKLNLGFETGNLSDWTATGNAFDGQPVNQDGISGRWAGQSSQKAGQYFIGGYEVVGDKATGQLQSVPFKVTHPYASYLFNGGSERTTR